MHATMAQDSARQGSKAAVSGRTPDQVRDAQPEKAHGGHSMPAGAAK